MITLAPVPATKDPNLLYIEGFNELIRHEEFEKITRRLKCILDLQKQESTPDNFAKIEILVNMIEDGLERIVRNG